VNTGPTEFQTKIDRLRELLDKHGVDGILLRRTSSFAWATCGAASYVNTASTEGAASLLVTRQHLFLVTSVIEATRLEQEEELVKQGWELQISPWETPLVGLTSLSSKLRLISDVPFPDAQEIGGEMARLRARLLPQEADRFRQLGRECSAAITAVGQGLHPGMSEYQIAAALSAETQQRGILPIVNLVATDERIATFRHPLPTGKKLEKYAMMVLSGRKKGLVCSITRLVYFGTVPEEIQQRILATAQVHAALVSSSRPGRSLGSVLEYGKQAYARTGFPEEWRRHHQGGVTGYEPREYLAVTDSTDQIAAGQALAWNPSIAGAKMEDTVLIWPDGHENLTVSPDWPSQIAKIPGQDKPVCCALALER
jgi:Xaa-Pro aminopeptidase